MTEPTTRMNVFAQRWLTLMGILEDHELVRLIKRAHLGLPETMSRASLIDALEYELQLKDVEAQLASERETTRLDLEQ